MVQALSISENIHTILRVLYDDMMVLCYPMAKVATAIAGIGALVYIACRIWQAMARAEPIDLFPLLRPMAIGICIMFFPTLVLGSLNGILSPLVQATHSLMVGQTFDMQEWRALQTAAGSDATRIKSAQYWTGNTGTNELGLNIVPAGKFWHGNVGAPDNAVDKASFWTTTKADATTAQMFEVFGWSNEILPWQFNSRPWSEGDGTASMLVNVRCVRDRD